jgi:hypothetical protein
MRLSSTGKPKTSGKFNGATCAYLDGIYEYFNAHGEEFHAGASTKWNGPCVDLCL